MDKKSVCKWTDIINEKKDELGNIIANHYNYKEMEGLQKRADDVQKIVNDKKLNDTQLMRILNAEVMEEILKHAEKLQKIPGNDNEKLQTQ